MRPLIGIMMRCGKNDAENSIQYAFEFVRRTILKAGGEPFFLTPPQDIDYFQTKGQDFPELTEEEKESIHFWLDSINGLFIPGGIKFTEYDRYVLKQARKKKIPVLAVCLGMQLLSCYEKEVELYDVVSSSIQHNSGLDQEYAHTVKIDKNSRLYEIIGKEEIKVNSFHKRCAGENEYYKTVARSDDGVIEALELSGDLFHIGVQWHPEKMYDYDIYAKRLIDAFIEESKWKATILSSIRKERIFTVEESLK